MQIRENYSLKPFNTFGIDVIAKQFGTFGSVTELEDLLERTESRSNSSRLILGGGSNVLFTNDFDGLVLKNEVKGVEVVDEKEDAVFVNVGAGVNWHQFVLYCLKNNYAGVENLSLIPGSVGASPMQNIGAYGVEIKDVFHSLDAYHLQDKSIKTFNLADCAFGYRESVFKNKYKEQFVILNVTYRLFKKSIYNISYGAIKQELEKMSVEELSIQAISQAVINIRTSKLPDWRVIGNAGSFFKNPVVDNDKFAELKDVFPTIVGFPQSTTQTKLAAGWLIEHSGWKGYRKGDAGCYEKQALVLVNYGNAKGRDIYELSENIIQSVKEKFDILLEREVNIIQ